MPSRFSRALATAATAALLTVSTAAAAAPARNPAAQLSVTKARAATPAGTKSRLGADIAGSTLINIGILAALVAGVLLIVADDGDSDSN